MLLAISNELTPTAVTDLDLNTNCENVWAKISYEGNKTLYLCTYYRPPSDKGDSLEQLSISLNRLTSKKTNSNIWVSGDFNLPHIYWSTPTVKPNTPGSVLHQQLLDILHDYNLTQVIDKSTRNNNILDLLCMTNPSFLNRVETLPPLGASDHDIVYSEINLALPHIKQPAHKVQIYKKANWEQIEKDLKETYTHLIENKDNMSLDNLWDTFKQHVQDTVKKNIPTKTIGNKSKLPWVNHQLKKLINKKNKLYRKKKQDTKYTKQYQQTKAKLQNQMRKCYWQYIENMIFDIEVTEPDQQRFNKEPKEIIFVH